MKDGAEKVVSGQVWRYDAKKRAWVNHGPNYATARWDDWQRCPSCDLPNKNHAVRCTGCGAWLARIEVQG